MTGVSGDEAGRERDSADRNDPPPTIDPLLADPAVPTGQTGAIERPGDDRPAWLVPILAVVLIGFVAVLAAVAAQRDDTADESDADDGTIATESDESDATTAPTDADAAPLPTIDESDDTVPDVASTVDLPVGSGTIVVDGAESTIVSACEDHRPFAPADDAVRRSSYAFLDGAGATQIIVREVRPDGPEGADGSVVEWVGPGLSGVVPGGEPIGPFEVELSGPDGGDPVTVSVDPAGSNGFGCDSLVVTNEPGQFAFPTSRVVVAACSGTSGDPAEVVGLLSTGGRFETIVADGSTPDVVELRIVDVVAPSGGTVEYVDADADAFVDADQRSFSGVVEQDVSVADAPESLDATVDLRVGDLPPCGDAGP